MVSRIRGCGDVVLGGLELVFEDSMTDFHAGVSTAEVSHESKPSSTISRSPVPESRDAARNCVVWSTRPVLEVIGLTTLVKELRIDLIVSETERLRLDVIDSGEPRSAESSLLGSGGAVGGRDKSASSG